MEYNTEREHLIIPEYGRHVQRMIAHATSLTDKAEQQLPASIHTQDVRHLSQFFKDSPHLVDMACIHPSAWHKNPMNLGMSVHSIPCHDRTILDYMFSLQIQIRANCREVHQP